MADIAPLRGGEETGVGTEAEKKVCFDFLSDSLSVHMY